MPERWTWYDTSLAQALPGENREEVSLVRGYAAIHAHAVMQGHAMIWPDPRLSKAGRHMLRVQQLLQHPEQVECDL